MGLVLEAQSGEEALLKVMVMEDGTMAVEAEEQQFRWCLDPIREVLSPEVVVVVVLASHGYPGLLMVEVVEEV